MAPQLTFGAILQEAREHKGMEVGTAARRLRIRPDILRAIEAEDFSRMPPRGYTRNMINAYARLVGLNPSEITRMYLDAAYAFQVGKARNDTLPEVGGSSRRAGSSRPTRSRHPQGELDERPPRQNALGRTLYDDRRTFTRGDYDAPAPGSRFRQSERTHPSHHTALPRSQYTNFYAGPQGNGSMQSRLPFVIAGVIILVLLIVILVLVFGPKDSQNQQDVTTVPITGLDDTTKTGEEGEGGEEQAQQTITAPTSVTVEYRVSSSADAYVEISVDGGAAAPTYLSAGTVETVDVAGTWSLSTWTTDLVQVTVDGEVVEFTQDGTNIPTCTVDFNAYLDQWITEHPGATITNAGTTGASNGSTTSNSSTGTNGASASNGTTSSSNGTSSNSTASTSNQSAGSNASA
ncbi:MAG: helix-turn-helix domain-containing protein [Eggerthellaceae bacterium]